MNETVQNLLALIRENDGINDKHRLARVVVDAFGLTRDRSVFYCDAFAIRFSASATESVSNTVASLSRLQKYDDRPFVVCVVTENINRCLIANTTFLKRISHTSQQLRENNIRGSFNVSDILQVFEGIDNVPENFDRLFSIHHGIGFEGNLARLVEATNNVSPTGIKFTVSEAAEQTILVAPARAARFIESNDCAVLKAELDAQVHRFRKEILLAALIENVNVRGRMIEYLIAGEDEALRQELVAALRAANTGVPKLTTANALGDYARVFPSCDTATDVKTKIMILSSNPKAYNLDKMLAFLANARSVFLFYFVGIDPGKLVNTVLLSMFQKKLLRATILLKHWSGRNSRGVTQFEGTAINDLILNPEFEIDTVEATAFLRRVIAL
jgi:hypothetical protein